MSDFMMTPKYELLLRGTDELPYGLYQLQLATAEQLCRLHYKPGTLTTVKAHLKTLADHGYVQPDKVPTRNYSSPYYYTLGNEGMSYLKAAGLDTSEAWRGAKETQKSWLFLDHALEVNDLVISAALLSRVRPEYTLDHFTSERHLRRQPYRVSWQGEHGTQTFTVVPDALLEFRHTRADGAQLRMPVLLEHDRGTEEQQHFRRRVHAYAIFIKTGSYKQLFQTTALTVTFTTFKGSERLEKMRAWTKQELADESPALRQAFCFATFTPPILPTIWLSALWQTPDDEQLALLAA